ncbi:MAG: hypothetical protein ABIX28_26330 [Vicinamibacterales bacterium]
MLFDARVAASMSTDQFTPSPDGTKFLIRRLVNRAGQAPVRVILNWRQLLDPPRAGR